MKFIHLILATSIAWFALFSTDGAAIGKKSSPDERQTQLTEVRAELAQLISEESINAAAIVAAPPGAERNALLARAAEIKKASERLVAREKQLQK